MFYTFSYTPSASDTVDNPHKLTFKLTAGIVHQVDFLFQAGCGHEEFVQIFSDNMQVWPTNRGETLRGDGTVISFREYYEIRPGNTDLTAKIWTTLADGWKEIIINIGLLPKHVIQPLSFEELITAMSGA